MFDLLASKVAAGGFAMYPLLSLAVLSPFLGLGLYALGGLLTNKVWALRFGLFNLTLGIAVPLLSWAGSVWRTNASLASVKDQVAPADWATIEAAAHSEMLTLPWAALLSSPWLVSSGFALLGLALLRHPSVANANPAR